MRTDDDTPSHVFCSANSIQTLDIETELATIDLTLEFRGTPQFVEIADDSDVNIIKPNIM